MKRTSILNSQIPPGIPASQVGPPTPPPTQKANIPSFTPLPKLKSAKLKSKMITKILFFAFVLGVLYGAILIREDVNTFFDDMAFINEVNITDRQTQPLITTFAQSFTSSTVFFTLIFIVGFSSIGQPATFLLLSIKGLGIGSSIGYMYINYEVQGLLYSLLILIPPTLIGIFSLIMLAKESVRLSNMMFLCFTKENFKIGKHTLKLYLYKSAVFYALILISSVVDAIMTFLFVGLFKL